VKKEYNLNEMRQRPPVMRDLPSMEELDRHIRIRTRLIIDRDVLDWCKAQARSSGENVNDFVTRMLRHLKDASTNQAPSPEMRQYSPMA